MFIMAEQKYKIQSGILYKNIATNQNLHEVKKDDEKLIELIDEWGKGDIDGSGGLECNAFQDMFPPIPPPEFLVDMCKDMPNNSSGLSSELPVPDDDIAGLEWLPTFVENSLLAGGIPLDIDFPNNNKKDDSHRIRMSNPVSVLENGSSLSGRKTIPLSPDTVVPERAGSKRPRSTAAIFNQQPALNLVSPKSSLTIVQSLPVPNSYISSKSEHFAESHPPQTPKFNGKEQKKKMKKKLPPSLPSDSSDHDNLLQQHHQPGVPVKKCSHCEITDSGLWRAGPMGPRTLCNACGLRYRSGRLIPEYRPAASPTFVASIHSNSHRKILEMVKVKGTPDR
ncbi:hypothetical protein MKW94_028629 [Papaver nudicaule]|uniref:GATA-type domain-containing protein n=1 Tax=Papaver nudicaule TaxID=74823 RepID=A0AA41W0T0_PAPNU|nr:hypothetical protein [Papaver nudicaule]